MIPHSAYAQTYAAHTRSPLQTKCIANKKTLQNKIKKLKKALIKREKTSNTNKIKAILIKYNMLSTATIHVNKVSAIKK